MFLCMGLFDLFKGFGMLLGAFQTTLGTLDGFGAKGSRKQINKYHKTRSDNYLLIVHVWFINHPLLAKHKQSLVFGKVHL